MMILAITRFFGVSGQGPYLSAVRITDIPLMLDLSNQMKNWVSENISVNIEIK